VCEHRPVDLKMGTESRSSISSAGSANANSRLIAHVIYRLQAGGMENGLINLLNNLPPDRYRHAIVCVTDSTDFVQRIHAKNVSSFSLYKREGKDVSFYWRFWQLMRKLRPAIVHTRNLGTLDLAPIAALAGAPVRIHSEHGWDASDPFGVNRKYRFLRKLCDPAVSQYIVVSDDINEWLHECIGIRKRKIRCIRNGVDTERFQARGARASLPVELNVDGQIILGTVGRMDPIKGLDVLVTAFTKLIKKEPALRDNLRLIVVGDGPLLPEIKALVCQLGISDLVWVAGRRDDIPDILRSLDIFVLASINEGISNTILESMASSLPVVATEVGGNAEVVRDGVTGFLVAPNDADELAAAVLQYVEDKALRRRHGDAARRRVEVNFDMHKMVTEYALTYERFLIDIGARGVAKQ